MFISLLIWSEHMEKKIMNFALYVQEFANSSVTQ
jgi:hypothetical protein